MKINQVLILDDDNPSPSAQALVEENKKIFKNFYPQLEHKVWGRNEIEDIIKSNFDKDVYFAFKSLKPYCYKSDLARFCILFLYGGFYFDIHSKPASYFIPNEKLMAFRDDQRNSRTSWAMQTSVLYSKDPGHKIFELTINKIVENVKTKKYGWSSLAPTGPIPFGESFVDYNNADNMLIGDFKQLTPEYSVKNYGFILPDGNIFAVFKNFGSGDINLQGSNNYNDMWVERNVYDENISIDNCL